MIMRSLSHKFDDSHYYKIVFIGSAAVKYHLFYADTYKKNVQKVSRAQNKKGSLSMSLEFELCAVSILQQLATESQSSPCRSSQSRAIV